MTIRYGLLGGTSVLDAHIRQLVEVYAYPVGSWPDLYTPPAHVEEVGPQILLINGLNDFDAALSVSKTLAARGRLEMVMLAEGSSTDRLRSVMRAGCRDLIHPYREADRLVELVAELSGKLTDQPEGQGEVISVLGCRGGIGVTTVAVSLSSLLAEDRRNAVVLIDVDQAGGDLMAAVDVRERYTTHDLLTSIDSLDVAKIRAAVQRRESGVWVLPQPEEDLDTVTVTERDVNPLIATVRRAFTHVVVDSGVAFGDAGRELAREAGQIVLVTDQEIVSLRTAVRRLRLLDQLGVDMGKVHVVLNRYNPRRKPGKEEIAKQLRHEITATIAADYDIVSAALDRGVSVVEMAPRHEVSENLRFLKAKLMGEEVQVKKRGWWLSR
ncbi:MAG: hypothetical protein H6739_34795 [Alphaproteobacteria bacterium]|nr:hypothetical protein [Alphaproteobacteria bacterium]